MYKDTIKMKRNKADYFAVSLKQKIKKITGPTIVFVKNYLKRNIGQSEPIFTICLMRQKTATIEGLLGKSSTKLWGKIKRNESTQKR